jgi:hypothetical protein
MGLEGISDGTDGGFKAAPGLAQVMQDEGTNDQNANILTLFLDNTTLSGGAPAPITDFVGSIDVTASSVVFNGNFTRERYGKAAVSDNITLDADRRSLLLDNTQTEAQKALSFISALEFDNGLTAVQNMSNSDVTNRDQPDLDVFENYPESMFNNAAQLNDTKETFVFDAIAASTDATQAFASYEE